MPAVTDRFAALSADEVREFLLAADVVDITDLIRAASESELKALVELEQFRSHGVAAILERFADFSDPQRLGEIDGVVRFDLAGSKRHAAPYTARFAAGRVILEDGTPDVIIALDVTHFLRLVTGEANAALLYLAGHLAIEGAELLALAVGSVFTVPGSGQPGVDPTALDPVEVATAVASTSAKHMRAVMQGGFRPIVLEEVFRRFPDFIDSEKSRDLRISVGFRIGGRADGEYDRYLVHVFDGVCRIDVSPDEVTPRDATIIIDGADFLRLATGQLHPVRGVLTGAMKVKGNRAKALALNAVMVPPQPRR